MAAEIQDQVLPLSKFYFSVKIGDEDAVNFQEVSGLDSETRPVEYRHGNSPSFLPIKMPGLGKVGNVTLRKGIFAADAKLWTWYSEIKMNTFEIKMNAIKRRTVVINLLDEQGNPKMVWALNNAWPTKIAVTDLKSEGNEIAVESVEICYETLTITAP